MIAGITIFDSNPDVTLAFYISNDEAYQEHRAENLFIHEMTTWAAGAGCRCLDYGIFTVDMVPSLGQTRFKESFGASEMFRDTLSIDLLPGD
ncbi:MAG: hypothetical protein V3U35_09080 [Candidatus Neomarinimicrobiota bacterium]